MDYGKEKGVDKLRLLKEIPIRRPRWNCLYYSLEDKKYGLDLLLLIQALQFWQPIISFVTLDCTPNKRAVESALLLAQMPHLQSLTLSGWKEDHILLFLSNSRSRRLHDLWLKHIHASSGPLSLVGTTQVFEPIQVKVLTFDHVGRTFCELLISKYVDFSTGERYSSEHCLPLTVELPKTLSFFFLLYDFQPTTSFKTSTVMMPKPLDFRGFENLETLIIDGAHERNTMISPDFFTCFDLPSLQSLSLSHCHINSRDFQNFLSGLASVPRGFAGLELRMFFGAWSDEEMRQVAAIGKKVASEQTKASIVAMYFSLEES
ncbi:hypothetical protein BT69DRAFT_1279855 [Atractiella rhizophila]|nr:hypothetical protein BT69DRAFT_1279855 [Atractiella rhizophila]